MSGLLSTAPVLDDEALLKISRLKNEIAEIEYESMQEVPHKLTGEEGSLYSNDMKTHSVRIATLEKHRGQAFALIIGQCTQLLLDKMKQEKKWDVLSASYNPLELYKLIESVVLKQTKDQYPVAALWDQISKSTMLSKVACPTPNDMRGTVPRWKWQSRLGACLPMTRLLTIVLS